MINEKIVKDLDLSSEDLLRYIERKLLLPKKDDSGKYQFDEDDKARLKFLEFIGNIFELKNESLDLVVLLIDQIYGLRSYVKELSNAINKQPKHIQAEIFSCIKSEEEYE